MILDAGHRRWAAATAIAAAASGTCYALYARNASAGPRGGSLPGLVFGAAALALMLFAGLLGARKKLRTWRLGRASIWMKGHLWLGLLAALFVLFHGGFRLGGSMTTWLMALLAAVTLSGIYGVVLQNVLPRMMTEQLPLETIYEQIPEVLDQLRAEADSRVEAVCGPLGIESPPAAEPAGEDRSKARRRAAAPPAEPLPGSAPLKDSYLSQVRPFLGRVYDREARLAERSSADLLLAHLRTLLPPALHEAVDDLASICEERRQLALQARLHHWLHGWILVHAPLSYGLLVLCAAHAIVALRY